MDGKKRSFLSNAFRGALALGISAAALVGVLITPQAAFAEDGASGATVNLHNYDNDGERNSINYVQSGRDYVKRPFRFHNNSTGSGINDYSNSSAVHSGILAEQLDSSGMPRLAQRYGGQSLGYLFNVNDESVSAADHYADVQGLLTYDEETGYWYYDSDLNFAEFTASGDSGRFELQHPRFEWDGTVGGVTYNLADPDVTMNKGEGSFMPFNTLTLNERMQRDAGIARVPYEDNQDQLVASGSNAGVRGYGLNETADYLFGLDITVDSFLMPRDGQVANPKTGELEDMIFDFVGDDDVWVYIDGRLALDLGGIHDAASGSINFHTGEIIVNGVVQDESLWDLMGKNFRESPYESHTLKFFYLERGAGSSNCRIRYNMPTIPSGTINVGKVVDYSTYNNVSDLDFDFKVEVKDSTGSYEPYSGEYVVYSMDDLNGNTPLREGSTTDGTFTLKHNEWAQLKDGITDNTVYRVTETGMTTNAYDVNLEGTSYALEQITDPDDADHVGFQTGDLNSGVDRFVTFSNKVTEKNKFNVEIKKEVNLDQDDTFYAMVMIGSKQYTGSYFLYDSDDDTSGEQKTTNENGLIELTAGQHAEIRGIVGGNTVTVYEVNADGTAFSDEDYLDPMFSMKNGSGTPINGAAENVADEDGREGVRAETNEADALGENPVLEVVMTNTFNGVEFQIPVLKAIDGRDWNKNDSFEFEIKPVAVEDNKTGKPVESIPANKMPMPECGGKVQSTLIIDNDDELSQSDFPEFGDVDPEMWNMLRGSYFCPITFKDGGDLQEGYTYYYQITEKKAAGETDLVYDETTYLVGITVEPRSDPEGPWYPFYISLRVYSPLSEDNISTYGISVSPRPFVNRYVSLTFAGLQETKQVVGHNANAEEFDFTVTALPDEDTNTSAGQAAELAGLSDLANDLENGTFKDNVLTFSNADPVTTTEARTIRAANELTLTAANVGHTYVYEYAEDLGEDSKWHQQEETIWRVSVAVSWVDENAKDDIQAALTLEKKVGDGEWTSAGSETYKSSDEKHAEPLTVSFTNVYNIYNLDIFKGEMAIDENGNFIPGEQGKPYADENSPLSGAEFTLYSDQDFENEVDKGTTSDGNDGVAKGHVILTGLEEGETYYLKETKVPSGYQLLGKTITIEVGRNEATFTIPGDEGEQPIVKTVQLDTDTATYSFSVANKPLPDLPSSGSNGTLLMMSTGFAAIVLAGTYLSKRFGHIWN